MKRALIFIVILLITGCERNVKNTQMLTDREWTAIYMVTLVSAEVNNAFVLDTFENIRFRDLLSETYLYCSDFGYSVNDSILTLINERKDDHVLLHKKIEKGIEVNFISEATSPLDNIIVYSEPIFLNSQMISIAMSVKSAEDGYSNDLIFFFRRENDYVKIVCFYDSNKDMYYRAEPYHQSL